jgi:hypothetical protein
LGVGEQHVTPRNENIEHRWRIEMLTKTKITLVAALIVGTATAALANDPGEDRGGFVVPGSMAGVNPAYHPDIFGSAGNASEAYNYVVPVQPKPRTQTK